MFELETTWVNISSRNDNFRFLSDGNFVIPAIVPIPLKITGCENQKKVPNLFWELIGLKFLKNVPLRIEFLYNLSGYL